ncbi:hypothetical protein BH10ACI1_BH10ACI1_21880 [soil metagenome]
MKIIILFTLISLFALNFSTLARDGENSELLIPKENAQVLGRVFWRGMVDAKVNLIIQDLSLKVNTLEGTAYPDGVSSFTAALPRRSVTVSVNKTEGRGTAQVIQQPTRDNDYTAIIEITDTKGGAKEYQVEVFWQ